MGSLFPEDQTYLAVIQEWVIGTIIRSNRKSIPGSLLTSYHHAFFEEVILLQLKARYTTLHSFVRDDFLHHDS